MLCFLRRLELLVIQLEKLLRLSRVAARDVVEGRCRDVVGLALADKRVVLEEVLVLRGVALRLLLQQLLCLGPGENGGLLEKSSGLMGNMDYRGMTYTETSSYFMSTPRVSLAAAASASPLQSLGPG